MRIRERGRERETEGGREREGRQTDRVRKGEIAREEKRVCKYTIWYDVRSSVSLVALMLTCHLTFPSIVLH